MSRQRLTITAAICVLTLYTVWFQIHHMDAQGGLAWYERVQWERIEQIMRGEQGSPWQYRLLSESVVYGTVRAFEALGIPRPIGSAFVAIRLAQNLALFILAVAYYLRLGLPAATALFGVSLAAFGMAHSLYDADMAFNTFTDITLFLAAALLILHRRDGWLIPLMFAAALNRETSGCIPFMLLFARMDSRTRFAVPPESLRLFLACIAIWGLVTVGLRLPFAFGLRETIIPTAGKAPILPLLLFNLTWWRTWVFLFATLGLLPLLALAAWRRWPPPLRAFFWAIVPVWFPVHFMLAHAPETRLFLVPLLVVFIPGALAGIRTPTRRDATARPSE